MTEDRDFPIENEFTHSAVIGLASPKDRLAAFVLDCILLVPLVQLIQAPVKKWILESLLFYQGEYSSFYELVNIVIFFILFVSYFTVLTFWKGQTLGKIFLKIKVISYEGKMSLASAWIRSVSMVMEFFCFGIPYLAVYSHSLRRPIHDRVSDTLVISLGRPIGYPSLSEKWKVRALALALSVLFFLMTSAYFISSASKKEASLQALTFDRATCEEKAQEVQGSLTSLIELYLVEKLHSECLFEQAREFLWQRENVGLAQFAVALSLQKDKEQSDKYLSIICKENPDDDICDFSQWLLGAEKDLAELDNLVKKQGQEDFIKVFAASLYRNQGDYIKVEEVVRSVQSKKQLEPLLVSLSFQSLLGQLKWEQAYWLYKTHSNLSENDVIRFAYFEMKNNNLGVNEQIDLLEFFFPSLVKKDSGRGLASTNQDLPYEVEEIYQTLKGSL